MESKSTHGLRLDQLADLLRIAAAKVDDVDGETAVDRTAERPQDVLSRRAPDEPKRPGTRGRKTQDDGAP